MAQVFERMDSLLVERRRTEEIPGLAAGVVCGDALAWSRGYGVMALDDPRPVTPATPFRIASLTKVFTATAVMKLVDAGVVHLDDPVKEHLAWFEIGRPESMDEASVTVRQLLTHTSGLPQDSRLTDFSRMYQPARGEAIAALPSQRLQAPPGDRYAYSNLGYGVLGEIIAEAGGSSYAEYLEQEILDRLEMTKTLVHPDPDDDTAWGHGPRQAGHPRPKAGFWRLGFATPAGGMASSIVDLSKFVRLQLAPYVDPELVVLSDESLRTMHGVHHVLDRDRGGAGLGWAVETSQGQHLVYHGGELPEQTAFMLIDLRAHIGVIVLTNAEGGDANGIAQEILRLTREAVLDPETQFPARAIPPG